MLSGGGPAVGAAIGWSSGPQVAPRPARPDQVGARRAPPFRGRYDRGAAPLRSYAIALPPGAGAGITQSFFRRRADLLDRGSPFHDFGGDVGLELLGAHRPRLRADLPEFLLELRALQDRAEVAADLLHDVVRGLCRREH